MDVAHLPSSAKGQDQEAEGSAQEDRGRREGTGGQKKNELTAVSRKDQLEDDLQREICIDPYSRLRPCRP